MSVSTNLSWRVGEDRSLIFTATTTTGISTWTFSLTFYKAAGGTELLELTSPTVTDDAAGVFYFSLTAAQTTTLSDDVGYFRLRRTNEGFETVLAEGEVTAYLGD